MSKLLKIVTFNSIDFHLDLRKILGYEFKIKWKNLKANIERLCDIFKA